MLFLVKVESGTLWHRDSYIKNPCKGNFFELREFDNEKEAEDLVWEEQREAAYSARSPEVVLECDNCHYSEEEGGGLSQGNCPECGSGAISEDYVEEEVDFVSSNSDAIIIKYDPTNPIHIAHNGFEEQRPEHVQWKREQEKLKAKERRDYLRNRRVEITELRTQLMAELEEINKELECFKYK
jgi:hypothetical protein